MKQQEILEESKNREETFSERMDRLSREAKEEIAKMTPEERAEFMEAARGHAEKVRDQITASYQADIRAGRISLNEGSSTD